MSDSEGSDLDGFTNEDIQDTIDRPIGINLEDFPNGEDSSAEEDEWGRCGLVSVERTCSSRCCRKPLDSHSNRCPEEPVFRSDTGPYSHS